MVSFSQTGMNVLHRGFIPPEEVAAAERQPIAMVRSHISWGSVIAGSIVTLALLMLSSSLAYACGVPVYTGTGPYGFGAGIWSVLSAIIAFGVGAIVSGGLSAPLDARYRVLHGLATWGLTILLTSVLYGRGLALLGGNGGLLGTNVHEMILIAPRVGPAWGAFISMLCGLIASVAVCGIFDRSVHETMNRSETVNRVNP